MAHERREDDTHVMTMEQVSIAQLHPDPANAHRISDEELESLTRSSEAFGFVEPVVVHIDDTVIGGHQRLVEARRPGSTEVPVIRLDISVEQGRLLGLTLNGNSGEWDEPLLARLLADLRASEDITLAGFGEDERQDLPRSMEARETRERPESFDLDQALRTGAAEAAQRSVSRGGPESIGEP